MIKFLKILKLQLVFSLLHIFVKINFLILDQDVNIQINYANTLLQKVHYTYKILFLIHFLLDSIPLIKKLNTKLFIK